MRRELGAGQLARVCFTLALAAASVGCGGDDADTTTTEGEGTGPLYLIATNFSTVDNDATYFDTSPSVDETTTIDSTDGPELQGGVVPTVHDGSVFAPDSLAPVLTRYDVGADDRLVRGADLSFAGVGMRGRLAQRSAQPICRCEQQSVPDQRSSNSRRGHSRNAPAGSATSTELSLMR